MSASDLSRKQGLAVAALLAGARQEDAAKAAGVSARQLRRWQEQEGFRAMLREGLAELLTAAGRKLLAETEKSITVLAEVRDDRESGPAQRVRAAATILTNAFEGYAMLELEERITELERLNDAQ